MMSFSAVHVSTKQYFPHPIAATNKWNCLNTSAVYKAILLHFSFNLLVNLKLMFSFGIYDLNGLMEFKRDN